jgi:outer membrane lipoprotein-sorting protein
MMKLAYKLLGGSFAICLLLFSGIGLHQAGAQNTPAFDQLKQSFEDGHIFHAEFTHRYEDSFTGETQQSEGVIWIGKEQYKIEGMDQIMVVDGEISRVYDGAKNRVIVSDYVEEEDDFAPSRMLQGVDDTYRVSETSQNGQTEIVLHSDDPFSIFETVTILLDSNGHPKEINATDQAENVLVTSFSNGTFTEPTGGLFDLETPADAELIDLRYNTQ